MSTKRNVWGWSSWWSIVTFLHLSYFSSGKRSKLITNFLLAYILDCSQCMLILCWKLFWNKNEQLKDWSFWLEAQLRIVMWKKITAKQDSSGQFQKAIYSHFMRAWSLAHRHHNLLRHSNHSPLRKANESQGYTSLYGPRTSQPPVSSVRWIAALAHLTAWFTHTFFKEGRWHYWFDQCSIDNIKKIYMTSSIVKAKLLFLWSIDSSPRFFFSPNHPTSVSPHIPDDKCSFL